MKKFLAATAFGTLLVSNVASAQLVNKSNKGYHVVESGDTLYDLAGTYYGDVYQWPKLWGYNVHITNPHWIYPGDVVYLSGQGAQQSDVQRIDAAPLQGLHLPVAGMVTSELEFVGEINGSPKGANMLSPHDRLWFDLKDGDGNTVEAKTGDLYAIVRPQGYVDFGGNASGQKYIVVGTMRVVEQSDDYYDTAEVVQAFREIERGDKLIKYERQLKVLQPIKSDKDMVAEIVDSIELITQFGEHHYVYVNRGAEDGVQPGNRFFVYHRSEGLDFNERESDPRVPYRKVGQLMLIDVRENVSLAVVTDTSREIHKGDRLEMYKGY